MRGYQSNFTVNATVTAMRRQGVLTAVPATAIDYTRTVEQYFAAHPLHPHSYRGMSHPSPVRQVRAGASLQAAIDALPSTGGTLILEPNDIDNPFLYAEIVGKSNVHIVGRGQGRTFCRSIHVFTDERARSYTTFQTNLANNVAADIAIAQARQRNIYIGGITFDGGNLGVVYNGDHYMTGYAIFLRSMRDVVIEDCGFQNYSNIDVWHPAIVQGNGMLDNIWLINNRFVGTSDNASFLDGAHGCGVWGNTVEAHFGAAHFLFLTNTDFSVDVDQDGSISADEGEQRYAHYNTVYGNTMKATCAGVDYTGGYLLCAKNVVTEYNSTFVTLRAKTSRHATGTPYAPVIYHAYNSVIRDNTIADVTTVLTVDGGSVDGSNPNRALLGKYTLTNNALGAAPRYTTLVNEDTPANIDGPNTVSGNTKNGVAIP